MVASLWRNRAQDDEGAPGKGSMLGMDACYDSTLLVWGRWFCGDAKKFSFESLAAGPGALGL